jgi:hypothetical protein
MKDGREVQRRLLAGAIDIGFAIDQVIAISDGLMCDNPGIDWSSWSTEVLDEFGTVIHSSPFGSENAA